MRSKLKLALSGLSEDEDFTRFLERALQDADKKSLLESRYCTELALYSIFQGNLDKAKYYTGSCVQLFLQVTCYSHLYHICNIVIQRNCFELMYLPPVQ